MKKEETNMLSVFGFEGKGVTTFQSDSIFEGIQKFFKILKEDFEYC